MSDEGTPDAEGQETRILTKDEILLTLDTAMASIATARMFIAKNMPASMVFVDSDSAACPHVNRAPSMPSFCLDCETEVE